MEQRIVLLTGAAGGIGQVLAKRFLEDGAVLIAVDIDDGKVQSLRKSVASSLSDSVVDRLHVFSADITSEAACRDLAEKVKERWGRIDVLVNNAGYFPTCDFRKMSYADWQLVMRVNLDAVFLMTSAFVPLLEGRGWGRIINIGSGSVFKGVPSQVHYVAAKSGVIGFTRSLARVLGDKGITVNIVAPGLTATPAAVASLGEAAIEKRRMDRAIARDQQPEDLTGAVMFIASPASDFMTGQTLLVDGGGFMH